MDLLQVRIGSVIRKDRLFVDSSHMTIGILLESIVVSQAKLLVDEKRRAPRACVEDWKVAQAKLHTSLFTPGSQSVNLDNHSKPTHRTRLDATLNIHTQQRSCHHHPKFSTWLAAHHPTAAAAAAFTHH
jgi:hypothetical protein